MTQYLKDDVRARILDAARREFAAQGYEGATMAAIATAADISTGNVYRYYRGKEKLFEAVVPPSLVGRFRDLLSARLEAAQELDDVLDLDEEHPYWTAAGRLLDLAVEHRLETVVFLGRAEGTRYETVGEEVVEELVRAAKDHSPALTRRVERSAALAFDLEEIYRNYVASLVRILERFHRPEDIREATRAYERYHLAGLATLLG